MILQVIICGSVLLPSLPTPRKFSFSKLLVLGIAIKLDIKYLSRFCAIYHYSVLGTRKQPPFFLIILLCTLVKLEEIPTERYTRARELEEEAITKLKETRGLLAKMVREVEI